MRKLKLKLKLKLEELQVDGFSTSPAEHQRGTVAGHSHWTCNFSCPGLPTCAQTCPDTCAYTCDDLSCAESCGGTCFASRCIDSCICG